MYFTVLDRLQRIAAYNQLMQYEENTRTNLTKICTNWSMEKMDA